MPEKLPFSVRGGYGEGAARRRIRLTAGQGQSIVELEDHYHAMRCIVSHSSGVIDNVTGEFIRYPLNTCPGAIAQLAELVGVPLSVGAASFFSGARARRNCTHMLDLAWLAARQAAFREGALVYDIDVPDLVEGRQRATLRRNGEVVLSWRLQDGVITHPEFYAGVSTISGFFSWALRALDGDQVEWALVLHKGLFVADARRFDLPVGPLSQEEKASTMGVCHGYAPATIEAVVRREGQFRDFTDRADDLLRFL